MPGIVYLCVGVGKVPAECGGVVTLSHAKVGERQRVRCFLVELKLLGRQIGGRSVEVDPEAFVDLKAIAILI
jgi:hypothetical protein